MLTFLFGEPAWFGWYFALWLSLAPGIAVWWWLRAMTPGAGPQGGLVAFMGLLGCLGALTVLGLVLVIRYAGSGEARGVARYVIVLGAWLLVWGVVAWKLGSTANTASLADASLAERLHARRMYLLLLGATGAAGLWLLARLRAAAGG